GGPVQHPQRAGDDRPTCLLARREDVPPTGGHRVGDPGVPLPVLGQGRQLGELDLAHPLAALRVPGRLLAVEPAGADPVRGERPSQYAPPGPWCPSNTAPAAPVRASKVRIIPVLPPERMIVFPSAEYSGGWGSPLAMTPVSVGTVHRALSIGAAGRP